MAFGESRQLTEETPEVDFRVHKPRIGNADDTTDLVTRFNAGRSIMCVGRQVHCPRPKHYRDEAIVPLSAGMAFIRRGPYDIRPELLTLAGGQKSVDYPRVLSYCRHYLAAFCRHENMPIAETIRDTIAERGLLTWLYKKKSPNVAEQARSMRMRRADYSRLVLTIYSMLRSRYREAVAHYVIAQTHELGAGRQFEVVHAYWNYGEKTARRLNDGADPAERHDDGSAYTCSTNAARISYRLLGRTNHENITATGANLCAGGASLRLEDARSSRRPHGHGCGQNAD